MASASPKKVLILGAAGPTALLTVRKFLLHNHIVTVYARNPSKLPTDITSSKNLKIVRGDLTETQALTTAIDGQDVTSLFSALTSAGIKQIIATGTTSIHDPEDNFSFVAFIALAFIWIIAHAAWKDIVTFGKLFDTEATAAGLDWTIFRLGFLGNKESQSTKAGYVAKDGWSLMIQRENIANWLVAEMEKDNSEWIRKRPAIWSASKAA
ncbi:hypothetical protein POJ06DRAFT_275323 [Lipomyces tetrasporus]|uniref:NAD(P)-binding domain-containing protein n=1 Tax=Lipomyces tetrasporus TaxID=54092 RepID=A0AAD7QRX1_9ASCO|nr:uncharacterized protein POJ06DRAFT_275323 [Lipomyces tetrasporus]KAJ8100203.1 hypothetical protein POJ06DRAFT_275323 [Lipomyces tetrasporus]